MSIAEKKADFHGRTLRSRLTVKLLHQVQLFQTKRHFSNEEVRFVHLFYTGVPYIAIIIEKKCTKYNSFTDSARFPFKQLHKLQQVLLRFGPITVQTVAPKVQRFHRFGPITFKPLHQKYNGSIDSSRFPTKPLHIMQQLHQCERISVQPHSINIKKSKK